MKNPVDTQTMELPGVLPVKRGRGRPVGTVAAQSPAARQAAYRAKLRAAGVDGLTVTIPLDVLAALDKFVEFKDLSKSDAVERILRDRLMRKR